MAWSPTISAVRPGCYALATLRIQAADPSISCCRNQGEGFRQQKIHSHGGCISAMCALFVCRDRVKMLLTVPALLAHHHFHTLRSSRLLLGVGLPTQSQVCAAKGNGGLEARDGDVTGGLMQEECVEVGSKELADGPPNIHSQDVLDGHVLRVGSSLREQGWETETDDSSVVSTSSTSSSAESAGIASREYEVLEVTPGGKLVQMLVSRRQLLRSSGLRLRDVRRIDPSLWSLTSLPAILVRNKAILLNLGSLRAIATPDNVLVFDQQSVGAQAFLECLHPRLGAENTNGPAMPFILEVVEAALISRTQRLENQLQQVEPRVKSVLEVLPTRYTADVLEELRMSKQALVELGSKAGALQQMLMELLEHQEEIRKLSTMGLHNNSRLDKHAVEEKEEEIEMLLEFYLQRSDSCHGQALKLLDAAREMEDSISVNLSSRRLEVSRLELLLQVATFCSALGALVAGIFGMNLKSYLEEHVLAFWITTAGIVFGSLALFIATITYLKIRRIL